MASMKYREDQILKLKELFQATQKALQLGNSYYEEANSLHQQCKSNCEKLDAATVKLEQIQKELDKQLQTIAQLVSRIRSSNNNFSNWINKLQTSEEETFQGLSQIFQKLGEKHIDAKLAENKTLLDYVDIEAVESLKSQATQEMKTLKNLQGIAETILTTIESQYQQLLNFSSDSSLRVDHQSSFTRERINLQVVELQAISSILVSIASQHDRISFVYSNRDAVTVDLTPYEHRNESEFSSQVSKIFDSLQRVQNISKQVETRIQRSNNAYRSTIKLVNSLDRFGVEVKNRISELASLETTFDEHREAVRLLFEELHILITWYELFQTAYNELLFEIVRRHQEHKRQQDIVNAYQRELSLLWKMENQRREHFFDFYGKYLPQSMCPAIVEPTVRYQIFPESYTTALPIISDAERPSKNLVEAALSQMDSLSNSSSSNINQSNQNSQQNMARSNNN